ncbi:MAG: hypothetical protein GKR87_04265 [Kiritimatiellae bacterium]|nr:hypothetical protein [Kiritimatiellia bacterium]
MSFTYDALNRLLSKTNALGHAKSYTYDFVGNRLTRTDAQNRTTQYDYDSLNNLTNISYPDTSTVRYQYDNNQNLIQVVDNTGPTLYTYDSMNRILSSTDHHGYTVSNGYDLAGNRTNITYPNGEEVAYSYDSANRLSQIFSFDFGLSTFDLTYDNANRLIGITYPNTVNASYTPDALGRIANYSYNNGSNIIDRSIMRNGLGHKTQETINTGLESIPLSSHQVYYMDDADRIERLTY